MLRSVVAGSLAGGAFEAQWVLAVRRKTWKSLHQRDSGGFRFILPPRDRFYADPFLLEHQGRTYIFFADYRYSTKKAVISCVWIDRSGDISQPVTVLEADSHLSYPFIFEVDRQIYLLPETSQTNRVELYRSVRFPAEWELVRVLMEQPAVDATLWQQGGTFWLFANLSAPLEGLDCEDLHLFFSNSLEGKWIPHPKNPVVVDVSGARPAGRLFLDGHRLIRPAQDCSAAYGHGIALKRVLSLSRTDYREEILGRITPEWMPGATGTHTLDHNAEFEVIDLKADRLKTVAQVARAVRHRRRNRMQSGSSAS